MQCFFSLHVDFLNGLWVACNSLKSQGQHIVLSNRWIVINGSNTEAVLSTWNLRLMFGCSLWNSFLEELGGFLVINISATLSFPLSCVSCTLLLILHCLISNTYSPCLCICAHDFHLSIISMLSTNLLINNGRGLMLNW